MCFATVAEEMIVKQSVCTWFAQQWTVTYIIIHSVPSSFPVSEESSLDLYLVDILLHSICVTYKGETQTEVRSRLIDIVCITNICVKDSCSPFTPHYTVACEACHNDRMAVLLS